MFSKIITMEQHILEQERIHPEATGAFTNLLYDIALAAKIISREIRRAGLGDIIGKAGTVNVQGEEQMRLDVFANETFIRMNSYTGRVGIMATEELESIVSIVPGNPAMAGGKYVLIFDPVDGSSNIAANVSVGTIFSIYRRKSPLGAPGVVEDCLQPGRDMVAAGYVLYGSSTMLVYTAGHGVHGFTLEPDLGEFLLSHPDIHMPAPPHYSSANIAYERYWSPGVQRFHRYLQGMEPEEPPAELSSRYIGSLVSDFHRNLLHGGVFYYPLSYADPDRPRPKLRLLYEAAPLGVIATNAGGYASDGTQNILDIVPTDLHQRTALFIGDRTLVQKAEEYIRKYG
ncbi:MAG: class 1 fructose-bisphosphatase [Anaerolineae bacterium]|nr:class 1 fructose-bisphosphatase [Anaerolineae bacterium]